MNKFNEIYDLVKEDRILRGETFYTELLNVFVDRQRVVKINPYRANTRKRETIPRDTMGATDTSGTAVKEDRIWQGETVNTELLSVFMDRQQVVKINQHFKINNGSEADMEYMLAMRDNLVHCVHFIDIYAPCIVGHSHWNDRSNMLQNCGKGGALFNEYLKSIFCRSVMKSFLLLVLHNDTAMATWMSELQFEQAKVSRDCVACRC
jgi:hypothetical protein